LIERLIDWGVDTIFGLPADGINGIFEALRTRQDKVKLSSTLSISGCKRERVGQAFKQRLGNYHNVGLGI
jgi:hypothetical protein